MSVDHVAIDDDDVVMILNDDNKLRQQKEPSCTSLRTINLDEEPSSTPLNESTTLDSEKDSSFARLLKNNTLMNKIVRFCLKMTNNAGMSRVINKTLQPLYADADSKFKESEQFTELLKICLEKLKYDPDHKFLHVKSLCEELKAGKYRRKVHFVTLCTDLKEERRKRALRAQFEQHKRRKILTKKNTSVHKETDVIALDNSDDEPIITLTGADIVISDNESDETDSSDDIMIVDETASSDVGSEQSNKENCIEACHNRTTNTSEDIQPDNNEITTLSNAGHMLRETIHEELINVVCSQSDNLDPEISNSSPSIHVMSDDENVNHKQASSPQSNTEYEPGIISNNEHISNKNNNQSSNSDLLVPKKVVKPEQHSRDYRRALAIERLITLYQDKITELEQQEVTSNCNSSPYILCDKYKATIVKLYKRLCRLTGNGDGDLRRHKVVRLQVMEGHPPGPVKRLECMLNNSVDETGTLLFPDFHDVLECVTQSNIADHLGWSKQQIMREAIALFTQCGHALRKKRQRREYKDLLNLVKDKSLDDSDPANEDPHLFAKLEKNKLVAKANEDEVLERFTRMEHLPKPSQTLNPRLGNIEIMRDAEDTDSENNSEQDISASDQNKINKTTEDNIPTLIPGDINRNLEINLKCSVTNIIDNVIKKAITVAAQGPSTQTQIDTTHETSRDAANITTQNPGDLTLCTTPQSLTNIIHTEGNYIVINAENITNHNLTNSSLACLQNVESSKTIAENMNDENRISMSTPNITHTTVIDETSKESPVVWSNVIHKMGRSNRYVLSFESEDNVIENTDNIQDITANTDKIQENSVTEDKIEGFSEHKTSVKEETPDSDSIETKQELDTLEDTKVKNEVKDEPVDINELLNALGDNYISTIFDIEDPFLVVEISSDSSDDDL